MDMNYDYDGWKKRINIKYSINNKLTFLIRFMLSMFIFRLVVD